jgi:hypothetical protein
MSSIMIAAGYKLQEQQFQFSELISNHSTEKKKT